MARNRAFPAAGIERASLLAIVVLAGIWGASRAASSGDLWVALGCGRYILSHGVTSTDPFSFNTVPGTWINQNWLSHVLFTLLQRGLGLDSLGIWKIIVAIAIGWIVASTARALGASRGVSALCAVAMALMGRPFYDVRPNLHTILLAAILIRWLAGYGRRTLHQCWPVPVLFILWANLHGGFLFGIVALLAASVTLAASATLAARRTRLRRQEIRWPVLTLVPLAGLAATIVSPYGITNLTHPYVITMGPDASYWRQVKEWMPPYGPSARGEEGVRAFWLLIAAGTLIAAATVPRIARRLFTKDAGEPLLSIGAVAAAGILLSITSRRFIPLLSVAMIPVLAGLLASAYPRLFAGSDAEIAETGPGSREGRGARDARPTRSASDVRAVRPLARFAPHLWISSACLVAVVVGVSVIPRLFLANDLWPASMGVGSRLVRADEQPAEAAAYLASSGARGRVLAPWIWGGRLLFSEPFENDRPRYQIYMDGRAQAAYIAAIPKDLSRFRESADAEDERSVRSFLDHYRIEYCVIDRRDTGIAALLPTLDGWAGAYIDDKSIVLARADRARDLDGGSFPDEAIRQASAAFALRTRGVLSAVELRGAFDHARASVRARPTTTGVTELTRIALAVRGALGDSLRAAAAGECDRILEARPFGETRHAALSLLANTTQCRAALARAAGDQPNATRLAAEATKLAREVEGIAKPYLR